MRVIIRRIAVLVLTFSLCGCAADEDARESLPKARGAPVAVEERPRLSVGVLSGDATQEFDGVRTPFLLADGRLVVPLNGNSEIRVFGADGAFIESLGGEGEGPGEFTSLESAWSRGDTIEAADSRLRRITRFLPDGEVEVVRLVGPPRSSQSAPPGAVPDGWVMYGVETAEYGGRDQMAVHWFDREGTHLGVIARTMGFTRIEGTVVTGVHPLSPRSIIRIGNGEIYVGETLTPRIQVLDAAGTLGRSLTWQVDRNPDPDAAMGLLRESPDLGEFDRRLLPDALVPEQLSVFWDLLVDDAGFVWVRPYDPTMHALALRGRASGSGQGGVWRVFDSDGGEVGSVEIPEGLMPTQITLDAVVGVRMDALDVESVHVYPLRRN